MASDVDELTVNYEEGGELLSREMDKVILSKGAWATIIFRYQDFNRAKDDTIKCQSILM